MNDEDNDIHDELDLELEDFDEDDEDNDSNDVDSDMDDSEYNKEYDITLHDHVTEDIRCNKNIDKLTIEGKDIHEQIKHIENELQTSTRNTEVCYSLLK